MHAAGAGEWVYLVVLHVEDATGELDALLIDNDAASFFQARLNGCEQLSTMLGRLRT